MPQSFNLALAPSQLTQTINPWSWTFGDISLFTVNLGQSSDPAFEARVLEQVGTYGRQIGRIGEALEVLIRGLDLTALDAADAAALQALRDQVREVKRLKSQHKDAAPLRAA